LKDVEVIIKPVHGATGLGIIIKPSSATLLKYDFSIGDVNLEEMRP